MSEEEKKAYNFYKECNDNDLSAFEYFSEPSKKQIKYMETLLNLIEKQNNRLEQLEKENKELKQYKTSHIIGEFTSVKLDTLLKENYIPKSVIRDKIEELEKEVKDYQCEKNKINLYQRRILEEILGGE